MPAAITNIILFQIGWFACVLGAANGLAWQGTLLATAVVTWHVLRSGNLSLELALVLIALLIGTVWDSLLVWSGIIQYQTGMLHAYVAPYWIIALWGLFATTLNVSLRWMRDRWLMATLAGAISGPLAYYAGYRLQAVYFENMSLAMIVLAVGWAIFVPALLYLSSRLDGYQHLSNRAMVSS